MFKVRKKDSVIKKMEGDANNAAMKAAQSYSLRLLDACELLSEVQTIISNPKPDLSRKDLYVTISIPVSPILFEGEWLNVCFCKEDRDIIWAEITDDINEECL